ncbi:MAG: hypothetical protein AN483_16210 [Aphanizomenon flos-aquae MDT14a]|jgi:hypothetical protein|nr:MAG: hypothetical protein AN483_16210 [Aphanizomenon flos-aquae MDT14a]QSV68503.1 MAG: hypothetical protein HEQ12_17385 [Aphanizomenon flos-aquae DEX188]
MDSKQPRERLILPLPESFRSASCKFIDDFGNYTEAIITQDSCLRIQQASYNHTVSLKLSKKDAISMITSILESYSIEPELEEFKETIDNLKAAIQSKFI